MDTIVTIIDEKLVNQLAAKLLVLGLQKHKIQYDNLFILFPSTFTEIKVLDWFNQRGALQKRYALETSSDPYFVKFLLQSF